MQGQQGHVNPKNTRSIPLSLITPSKTNKHTGQRFKRSKLLGLAASMKSSGVIQPLVVRGINDPARPGKEFEIVAGERRYRAATLAELAEVPCVVTKLGEAEALQVQLTENLQREDLHPLDEARSFLRLKKESELDVIEIALRVGKPAREVARTLALNDLIKEGRQDFRKGYITLGHALEICVFTPDVQRAALAACYEKGYVPRQEGQGYDLVPDKSRPARSVRELQAWLEKNVRLNLRTAPFKTSDARLREDGRTCLECPNRTGFDKTLFADVRGADTCLDPGCFNGKVQALIQITSAALDAKREDEQPAPVVSPFYSTSATAEGRDVLNRNQYEAVEGERCEFAEQALYVEGAQTGKAVLICREATCKDHLGRVKGHASVAVVSGANDGQQPQGEDAKRKARKQELFDIKVDEAVRLRVMAEALKTFGFPFDRPTLNMVALAHFRRIPTNDQRTIITVFGLSEEDGQKLKERGNEGLDVLARETDERLGQFMVLCSIAHFGANQYGNKRVSQAVVTSLADVRGVNHRLIEAEVRHELSPNKYKAEHAAYLEAVREGREAVSPVVYERQPKARQDDEEGASQQRRRAA
jgi:ParB/RepB/Spo0J family partition protein